MTNIKTDQDSTTECAGCKLANALVDQWVEKFESASNNLAATQERTPARQSDLTDDEIMRAVESVQSWRGEYEIAIARAVLKAYKEKQ